MSNLPAPRTVEVVGGAPAPEPARPRVLLVGTALASGASFMVFAGMVGIYLSVRSSVIAGGDSWLPAGAELPLTPANMGLFTLLMAAVTMQWAVDAMGKSDRPHAYLALGTTLLLGVSHVVMMAYYYTQMNLVLNGESSTQAVLIYSITGLHLAMVVAALVFISLMAFRALGGQLTGRDREGVASAAMFWHVTIAVYTVVWYSIFIVK
ncbi:MAG TPA: cytochrome c oxidase subunit 3 [Acidimicrobiales bacterium]|nr:cytochrome c oxidase subunit 3 [Acidimicrobiales bacterium]